MKTVEWSPVVDIMCFYNVNSNAMEVWSTSYVYQLNSHNNSASPSKSLQLSTLVEGAGISLFCWLNNFKGKQL